MNIYLDIKGLGVKITPETPDADIEKLCVKFPLVKKLIDKAHGKKENSKSDTTGTK